MSEEANIEIVEYKDDLAQAIADMWNTWDDLWIGGFTQGVPFTRERVAQSLGSQRALALLVAIDQDSQKPVGYCSLLAHWRDPEAAYVGVLGVSPEALGKKVGKRLLLRANEIASDQSYTHLTLNTWAGNLRAVPLYKKIGMMWNPEADGVQFESYVPEIMSHPLCSDFFELHSDPNAWYDLQVREIAQAPDDVEEHGMGVYKYEFVNDSEELKVTVDRLARGITGVSRNGPNRSFQISARVDGHLKLCGIPSEYTIVVTNEDESAMEIEVSLGGFDGLVFTGPKTHKFKVGPGKTESWTAPFYLDSTAETYRIDRKTRAIIANLSIDGQKSILRTGLRIRPAAEIRITGGASRIIPGGTTTIPVMVVSHSKSPLKGDIVISEIPFGVEVTPASSSIELGPEGLGGLVLQIRTSNDTSYGGHELWAKMKFKLEQEKGKTTEVETRKFRIPIYVLGDGSVAIGENDARREVTVIGDDFTIRIAREGGGFRLSSSVHRSFGFSNRISSQIGPPFGLSPFRFAERDVKVEKNSTHTTVSLLSDHPERPLRVEERATFNRHSGTVIHEVWATNTGDVDHTFQLRLLGGGGGISLARGSVTIPLSSGLVEGPTGNFMFSYPSIPEVPEVFSEGWVALTEPGNCRGQLWDPNEMETIRIAAGQVNRITYPMITLKPQETRRVSRLWNAFGLSDASAVSRLWQTRVGPGYVDSFETEPKTEARGLVWMKSNPVVVPSVQETISNLTMHKSITAPLGGHLRVHPPDGWTASFEGHEDAEGSVFSEIGIGSIDDGKGFEVQLTPADSVPDGFSIHRGRFTLQSHELVSAPLTVVQLGTKSEAVSIHEEELEGVKVFRIRNGLVEFTVSAKYGGCITSLKNSRSTELLLSNFPNPSPKSIMENYYGGLQPIIWDSDMDEDLSKARTNQESMRIRTIEEGIWSGVQISWTGKVQRATRGVQFGLSYLTAPGSPLVMVRLRMKNVTTAPFRFYPGLFVDCGFNGKVETSVIKAEWNERMTETYSTPIPAAVAPSINYIWVQNGADLEGQEGLALLAPNDGTTLFGLFVPDLKMLGAVNGETRLAPGAEKTIIACLFVDPPDVETLEELQKHLDSIL